MNKLITLLFVLAILASFSVGQSASGGQSTAVNSASPSPQTSTRFAPGTTLRVELEKTLDAKKAKTGDEVTAKTMDELMSHNTVAAPKGLRVIGHIVAAAPHQGETPSTLTIAFDRIIWKDGSEIPLSASIQAIGKPESYVNAGGDSTGGGGYPQSGQQQPGGVGRGGMSPSGGMPSGGAYPSGGNTGGTSGEPSSHMSGQLPINAQGVVGMSGVTLTSGSNHESVVSEQKHNVKLDSGTQMVLRVS